MLVAEREEFDMRYREKVVVLKSQTVDIWHDVAHWRGDPASSDKRLSANKDAIHP
jgi:hypothetical protein